VRRDGAAAQAKAPVDGRQVEGDLRVEQAPCQGLFLTGPAMEHPPLAVRSQWLPLFPGASRGRRSFAASTGMATPRETALPPTRRHRFRMPLGCSTGPGVGGGAGKAPSRGMLVTPPARPCARAGRRLDFVNRTHSCTASAGRGRPDSPFQALSLRELRVVAAPRISAQEAQSDGAWESPRSQEPVLALQKWRTGVIFPQAKVKPVWGDVNGQRGKSRATSPHRPCGWPYLGKVGELRNQSRVRQKGHSPARSVSDAARAHASGWFGFNGCITSS